MRIQLTALIIGLAFLNVAAKVRGQNVNITATNVPLSEVFKEITKQTGYLFWYKDEVLNTSKKVNLNVKNVSVQDALDALFKEQLLTYKINDKTIVISARSPNLYERFLSSWRAINVNGQVLDENKQPLAGATIKVKGSSKQTTSNQKGEFLLENIADDAVLQISFVGYIMQEINVRSTLTIIMRPQTSNLEEIQINAGYYSVTDKSRTGSISRVDSKTIAQQPVNNPLMALQNRVPGLQITQQSGVPGGGFAVQIRGRNSISSGTDPLYIIDGVTFPSVKISSASSNTLYSGSTVITGGTGASPLSTINPDDIESIEVLKDADATAIYGSRGANGVILITTKRGKLGTSNVNASVLQGFSEVGHQVELLNTEQYLMMRKEALKNDGVAMGALDHDLNGTWDANKYTDWQNMIIGGKANTTNASVTVTGGNEHNNYLISGNYYGEGSVFLGNSNYKRGGIHTSIKMGSPNSRLTALFTGSYSNIKSNLLRTDPTWQINLPPNAPDPYDQYGNINWANNTVFLNPVAEILKTNVSGTNTFVANAALNFKIISNLDLSISAGLTRIQRDELAVQPLNSLSPALGGALTPASRISDFSDTFNNNIGAEPQLTYKAKIGNGRIDALVGMSFQENNTQMRTVRGTNFSSDDLMGNLSSAATLTVPELRNITYRYSAAYARLNYALSDKYFVNLTGRRDGSTRFGLENQFATFGAIGAGWIFSEEKLIKDHLRFLSFGKLRASYGVTGNDQITDYQFLQLWNNLSGTYQGLPTLRPVRIANPNFSWETNKKAEIALQLGMLKDRLRMEVAYYHNRSSDQLVGIPLPPSVGFTSIQANFPATVQNTGLEFDFNFRVVDSKKLKWTTNFNVSIPRNKLVSYTGIESSSNNDIYTVGQPLTIRKVYNTSLDPATGLYVFEDYDKNGTLNARDRYINKFLGQYFYGGFQNSFSFGNFNLDLLISFTKQNGNNYLSTMAFAPGTLGSNNPVVNYPIEVLSRWQKSGDVSDIMRFTSISATRAIMTTARGDGGIQVGDASFIRLKNVSMSYNLPSKWLNSVKLKGAQLVMQGQNIYTLTNYVGLDPETQSMNILPPLRSWTIGARINL